MNRIDQTFSRLKQENQKALIPFLTVGDPTLAASLDIIEALEQAGADIIELGVPYSDPLADGPVIQRASQRALEHHVNIQHCIETAKNARNRGVQLPFILFTYYNPVLQYGLEGFFKTIVKNDISGLIIPDLPHEEDDVVRKMAEQHDIHLIPLVAPTSNDRIRKIVSRASGFVYCVSSLGVTGMRTDFHKGIDNFLNTVKQATDVPIAVGFGVSKPQHVAQFSRICDGVVVGSAIVRKIEDNVQLVISDDPAEKARGIEDIKAFVASLKEGTLSQVK